ncbi:MAG: phosphoribosyltransferase [Deltaproteobacteria bacterium]|jgi:hypothetical protein|nr:phosphoribosyltransferase [Deltaproteobacteria bacterium]
MGKIAFVKKHPAVGGLEGVYRDKEGWRFIFQPSDDSPDDSPDVSLEGAVNLPELELKESKIFDNTYFYGYKFASHVPSSIRNEFIKQLKGLSTTTINKKTWEKFIFEPINLLSLKLQDVDSIICPKSERTLINEIMVNHICNFFTTSNKFSDLRLFKMNKADIKFNHNQFEIDNKDKLTEKQYKNYLTNINNLMNTINNGSGYFSISEEVKKHLFRRYLYDFLTIKGEDMDKAAKSLHDKHVLLIDDINTTQSTLMEALRVIHKLALPKKLTIFTLIGNDHTTLS